MNEPTLQIIINEISPILQGQKFGKIFPLGRLRFVIDFRLKDSNYLFLSLEPFAPRVYLTHNKLRDLEKQALNPNPFLQMLRKRLSNAIVLNVTKDEKERIVRLKLLANDEFEGERNFTLIIQLTGRSSNIFLLDDKEFILDSLRENEGDGQTIATRYAPPVGEASTRKTNDNQIFPKGEFATFSEALSHYYQQIEVEKELQNQIKSAEAKLRQEIAKREKLQKKLQQDLDNHGNAEHWKRLGDLLLANLANAVRIDDTVLVTDYFDENAPTIEIEVAEHLGLTEAAEKLFKRYTKARNARQNLEQRIQTLQTEIAEFEAKKADLKKAVAEQNLSDFLPEKIEAKPNKQKEKQVESIKGARRYISSDGWEILVGKASKDNDYLTFRIAKSLDFWLHAADYGGSHVVVRNPNRAEQMPPKTLLESAQLAAQFSQAKEQPKVAVNYTQKKFVNKPKGAAAGLVSLSSFKTILVEPKESLSKIA